jgi:hypothetical protein
MTKYFYVVVSFAGGGLSQQSQTNFLSGIFGSKKETKSGPAMSNQMKQFEEYRSQLEQRLAVIIGGLTNMGIQSRQLETAELIELYQTTFNPGELHSAAGALTEQKR